MQNQSDGSPSCSDFGSEGQGLSRDARGANERVRLWLRPSIKEIMRQEARRRGAQFRAVINIGLEEVDPRGRPIPTPNIFSDLLSLATRIRNAGWSWGEGGLYTECARIPGRFEELLRSVTQRLENRRECWREKLLETQSESIWVYLSPSEAKGLRKKANQEGKAPSSLLRTGLIKGIKKRNRMSRMKARLQLWHKKSKRWISSPISPETYRNMRGRHNLISRIRRDMRELGREIDSTITASENPEGRG